MDVADEKKRVELSESLLLGWEWYVLEVVAA
jgi:hypothetical protein